MGAREAIVRVGLEVDIRKTPRGPHRHRPTADHVVSVHAGAPVRVSCVNDVRCVRTRGLVTVMPAGSSDEWFEDDASDHVDLRLPSALVRLAAAEMGLDPERATVAQRCHVEDAPIEHIAWALAAECRAGEPNGLLYRESLGMALAVHLLAHHRQVSSSRMGLTPAQLSRVKEYVEAHLDGDVSLLRLARVAGVSASHLRVLFKRSMGVSVHAFVIQRRVERARLLLSRGDLPASEVALEAGFSHQSHMARCMRRVLGVSPNAIRRAPAASSEEARS